VTDITPIRPAEPVVNYSIVNMLTDLLERAKQGEIIEIAGVMRLTGREFEEFFSRSALTDWPLHFISYLRVLQMRFERQIPLDPPT
jgi:hypothetical protein